jgi:hypothetical protein
VKYFFSDYGMATITVRSGIVQPLTSANWTKWEHDKGDIEGQFYWGIGAGIIGLFIAYRTLRAAALRVVIDDSGMTYGSTRIPFSAMRKLTEYKKKGLCSLYYEGPGEQERRLRLDSYKVAKFEELIDALCAAKGFPNPRPPVETENEPEEKPEAP